MPMKERNTNEAYLLIGGNKGNREQWLLKAIKKLQERCGIIKKTSSVYETAAWGKEDQEPFLNQALWLQTPLSAQNLLTNILTIEKELGRTRNLKYGPRTIDIDILLYNEEMIKLENLTIPHPQMQNRKFALLPLREIAGEKMHPILKKSIAELLKECKDSLDVKKIK